MARPIVLVVDSDMVRLAHRRRLVEAAGAAPLLAPTLARARLYLGNIHVTAVLTDAHLADGHGAELLSSVRANTAEDGVPLVVLGPLTDAEWEELASNPLVHPLERCSGPAVLQLLGVLLRRPLDPAP